MPFPARISLLVLLESTMWAANIPTVENGWTFLTAFTPWRFASLWRHTTWWRQRQSSGRDHRRPWRLEKLEARTRARARWMSRRITCENRWNFFLQFRTAKFSSMLQWFCFSVKLTYSGWGAILNYSTPIWLVIDVTNVTWVLTLGDNVELVENLVLFVISPILSPANKTIIQVESYRWYNWFILQRIEMNRLESIILIQ